MAGGGLFELVVGAVLVAVPEPATTAAGVALLADGARRTAEDLD